MARALLLVLVCAGAAAAAAGARYSDYASGKMPNYGAVDYEARAPAPPLDDYRDRDQAPDAPAPLDYKYEEIDKIDKYITNDVEDDDSWKKPVKKLRKPKNLYDADPETYKIDEVVPKYQARSRSKNRGQYRKKSKARSDELLNRRYRIDDENQQMDTDDEDTQTHPEGLNGDNSLEHEHVNSKIARKQINKKIRRKPRDRPNLETRIKSDIEDEDNMNDVRDIKKSILGSDRDYPDEVEDERRRMLDVVARDEMKGRQEPEEDEPEQARAAPAPRAPPVRAGQMGRVPLPPRAPAPLRSPPPTAAPQPTDKTELNEYADYYDMKRVQNIKSKLPPLLRRTKAKAMAPTASRRVAPARTPKPVYRRKNVPPVTLKNASATAAASTDYTTTSVIVGTSLPQSVGAENISKELSIAEKSRLSILKKAHRKESWSNGSSTNKPPVLLQVTQRLHTVVIVEPPMEQDLWLRAKEISDDSPERLEKVKRLMRHKLVANAKNIRELTDDWDALVCDYVDVAMIDRSAAPTAQTAQTAQTLNYAIIFHLLYQFLVSYTIR